MAVRRLKNGRLCVEMAAAGTRIFRRLSVVATKAEAQALVSVRAAVSQQKVRNGPADSGKRRNRMPKHPGRLTKRSSNV
jgi:hypothetical protein